MKEDEIFGYSKLFEPDLCLSILILSILIATKEILLAIIRKGGDKK